MIIVEVSIDEGEGGLMIKIHQHRHRDARIREAQYADALQVLLRDGMPNVAKTLGAMHTVTGTGDGPQN